MGEQAELTLGTVCVAEGLRDSYAAGFMADEEATEHGFISCTGVESEGTEEAWERSNIGTREQLDTETADLLRTIGV